MRLSTVLTRDRDLVGLLAEQGEPAGVADDDVELVAMDDEEPPAVGGDVDRPRSTTSTPPKCVPV